MLSERGIPSAPSALLGSCGVVVATHNPHKLAELRELGGPLGWRLEGLEAVPGAEGELPEPGPTLRDNALAKAAWVFARAGRPTLGDDTGLEVDALDGAPGVYTARYGGPGATAAARQAKLLAALGDRPWAERAARFRCVLVLELGGDRVVAEGLTEGTIAFAPTGSGGFGYDSLFVPAGETLSYAALASSRLAVVGHRARAFAALRRALER